MDNYYGHVSRLFSFGVVLFTGIIFSSLVVAAVTDSFSESAEAEAHLYKKLHISQISKFVEAKLIEENQGKLKYLLKCQDSMIFND
ncbi:hypothetical protein TRFO_23765 [Tritrichomonas foetus]|uniref:Ion transport domain-containing protein n=1 Tax=Tritrichomonas foetus TaxID=1144522 RepID=A0A1J4KDN8_9EUKA|nr:hypothetical protein TRFO_23765 [Tritrichomonas foetus]|eukprot:OHT07828.1 hypothetical protein TRFO_23765 [Tritrichomonas foetus]